ncbi:MAG TPA: tetratricopeptide repeat protein [Candidatus Polarisedimenticolia bacterium]|jgi:regulator of sirC expression with transglutaminase-like and TPR domain|nr:tetratricopeptide repeat protein [Candidatus Polarisedimenticolia bacterium]
MTDPRPARQALQAILALPDEAIDLGQAALLIARQEYPDLEVGRYLSILDDMGAEVKRRLRGGEGPMSRIGHLNRFLFEDLGFRGNVEQYDDPRNSFLNDVLDRRVGIPISLSTVYLEVGRRCGCPLDGVSFPGHFLVRWRDRGDAGEILLDPFHRGRVLTEEECRRRLLEQFGGRVSFRREFLRRARTRDILERTLVNLKLLYEKDHDYHRALMAQESLVFLSSDDAGRLRDRGLLYFRLACFGQARADLERYLELAPGAADSDAVRRQMPKLRSLSPVMN